MNGYQQQYTCIKCGNHNFEEKKINFKQPVEIFQRFLMLKIKKFITISCSQCGYTELFKAQTSYGNEYFKIFY